MTEIDNQLGELLNLLYWPVMAVIGVVAVYTVWIVGRFLAEASLRIAGKREVLRLQAKCSSATDLGELELVVMRELEGPRLVSRVMPMLGLIATMIPLGPALASVAAERDPFSASSDLGASSDMEASAADLGSAFAAVIVSLLAASVAFVIYTVRRRWLLTELESIRREIEG